ncbi:hypothetical protein G1H11_08560 [Phytoactinopolyspora alkaliphila]|uniref:Mandelate racemase/muconate lactonizing enzyme C-terminal domain-containing protein n=1 Tax=Phytoactinopolyspora alkaliphila TaxID=1783498 RepID=A0A6N9YK15_9ACTN|nr:hypothetical protein [Phytoactinopolyspora alkaliphila]
MNERWRCADDVIDRIEVGSIRKPASPLNARRWGPFEYASSVEIHTAGGLRSRITGRAHVGLTDAVLGEQIRWAASTVTGRPLTEHAAIWDTLHTAVMRQYISVFALSVLDVALWDLRAQSLGLPVAALLDPGHDGSVQAYASLPIVAEPPEVRPAVRRLADAGFVGVKVHTAGDLAHDTAVLRCASDELAGGGFLAYDAAGGLCRDEAAGMAGLLQELAAQWFEEPFRQLDIAAHEWLRDRTSVPLAGVETVPGGPELVRLALGTGAFDLVCVDSYWKGGITGASATVRTATEMGRGVVMHHGASPEMDLANIHVATGLACGPVELMPATSPETAGVVTPPISVGIGLAAD